jgi:hypothetical protein
MVKYIIYKASGGLVHMLKGIHFCIQKAKETNTKLIIDTLNHSAFKMDFSSVFFIDDSSLNYSDAYDECPVGDEIRKAPAKYVNGQYFIGERNISIFDWDTTINDVIIYAGAHGNLQMKNIKVVQKIKDDLDNEKKIEEKYIAGHFRNTDMKHDINEFIDKVKETINKTGIKTFYLATDDSTARERIASELPVDITIVQNTVPPANIGNLHYGSKDKYKQVYECLRDFYFILGSDEFIPSRKSGMSRLAMEMRKNKFSFFDS